MKKQVVYLDMDGTIANLYGMENWLENLINEVEGLFLDCEPFITEEELLKFFPTEEYELRICSMTPLNATEEYCQVVINEKNQWLDKYFPSITHRVYMAYGNNKNLRKKHKKLSTTTFLVSNFNPLISVHLKILF